MNKFSYHKTAQKEKENLFHKSWNFTLIEFNFTYIQQVQDINTNSGHNMNDLAPRALLFFKSDICELLRSCKISKDIFFGRWNNLLPYVFLAVSCNVCPVRKRKNPITGNSFISELWPREMYVCQKHYIYLVSF